jgi:hypothetical protein
MQNKQRGVSLGGLVVALFILIIVGLLGMKVIPPYLEFASIKKAVVRVAQEKGGAGVNEIRKAFDGYAAIDDFAAVKGSDLEITKEGGQVVVSCAYRKEVPLFQNLGIYWDFAASSKDG